MAYQVTITNTPQTDNPPGFAEWVTTLDSSVLSDYPEYNGMTPEAVVVSFVTDTVYNPAKGYISENVTVDDNGVETSVTLWESQEDYESAMRVANFSRDNTTTGNISCQTDSATVTGTNTQFTQEISVGDTLISADRNDNEVIKTIGTVQSVTNDTELVLTSNAVYEVVNLRFAATPKVSALGYLQNLYDDTYPTITEITYANV